MNTLQAVPAADRVQIVDALYRFGAGQDLRDRTLFDAAFAEGARLDFRGPARKLGMSVPVFEGRRTIGDTIFATISHLDTTHTVTNPRVTAYDGEHARLFALVAAEHLPKDDHSRHLLLENIYVLWLSRAEDEWVIDHMQIENVWMRGDPTVLFGAASS